MPFSPTDIVSLASNFNSANEQNYVDQFTPSFIAGRTYLLVVASEEAAQTDSDNSLCTPATDGIAWGAAVETEIKTFAAMSLFIAEASATQDKPVSFNFPAVQARVQWGLVELKNSGAAAVQTVGINWAAQQGTIVLPAAVTAGSIVIGFTASAALVLRSFTEGADHTELVTPLNRAVYQQFNLGELASIPVGTQLGGPYFSIAVEMPFTLSTALAITSVNGNNSVLQGESIVVVVANADVSGNTLIVSSSDDIEDPGAIEQVLTAESATSLSCDLSYPVDHEDADPLYFFLRNTAGDETTPGFTASITQLISYPITIVFDDDDVTDVDCTSLLGFELGWSMVKRVGGDVNVLEFPISITTTNSLPTAEIILDVTWPTGEPDDVAGDVVVIDYDDLLGDIQSVDGDKKLQSFTTLLAVTC